MTILQLREAPDPELFERAVEELGPRMRRADGFQGLHVVYTGELEVILLILAESIDDTDRIATEIGSPWMIEHVVPHMAAPPKRHLADVIATAAA